MTNVIQTYIRKLSDGIDLDAHEAQHAFQIIMNGGATPAQMAAFLMGMRSKGETVTEITEGAKVLRAKAEPFPAPEGAVDTCGTGGDARNTLNISTAVAVVVAACGVPVVKHGNRSVSSRSGSSDVLTELGVDVNAPFPVLKQALAQCGLTFLMAPRFHKAMRHVAPVRQELGLRTVFNLLGPLSNPAKPAYQVVGVFDRKWLLPLAEVLRELGCTRAWVVHGSDGMDELTTTGPSHVAMLAEDGSITEMTVEPASLDIPLATPQQLAGDGAAYNARRLQELLQGQQDAYRDIVLLNTAAALVVAGKAASLADGLRLGAAAIDSGKAKETLATLVSITGNHEQLSDYLAKP